MTDSSKGINNYIARYRNKFASMERFRGWHRNVQKAYIRMRQAQLEEIIKDANDKPFHRSEQADKLRYRKIQREMKSKDTQFALMDRLDHRERLAMGLLHPTQTVLERFFTPKVCGKE